MIPRFETKFTILDNGCWRWDRSRSRAGYGYFKWQGKQRYAHTVSWEWLHGMPPEGMELDHYLYPEECIGPSCVNPEHLKVVTSRENTLRSRSNPTAVNARRTECVHGHPLSGENLHIESSGKRSCRTCKRIRINMKRRAAGVQPRQFADPTRVIDATFVCRPV